MATNQINVGINVSSNGTTDQETKKAKGLKDMLDQTALAAGRAGKAMAASRGGGGRGTISSQEVMEYGRGRAVGVGTGASARDFANQAQGLGGLVRIYATLAANIFAATAAFSALSRAMDTTNMIKGLDQLGAASGTALGSLSKQLVVATDGAVSLREAMDATVKASSAGLNTDQILRLGQVSKTAAQALGLNMTDALSRLSRGISKLEPELLDELGIFVRIDDAVAKYALSVGKATSGLTDFERRQAFANAVLEQGERKFGEIDIPSNPYTKLAAALQNLAQTGLEFVNKFLGPVAKLLADNSALLAGAVALIGTKLVGMAIPALSQWRAGLVKTAADARDNARAINTAFGEAWVTRWENRLRLPELRAAVTEARNEVMKLGIPQTASDTIKSYFSTVKAGTELHSNQQRAVTRAIGNNTKAIQDLGTAQDAQSKKRRAQLQAEINQLQALLALNAAVKAASGPEAVIAGKAEVTPGLLTDPGQWARGKVAERAVQKSAAATALSFVSRDTLSEGFTGALKNLNTQLNETGVKGVTKFTTLVRGGFAAAATTIGLFVSALSTAISVIGLVVGTGAAVLNFFSNTEKQAKLTSEAFDRMEGAVHSATVTMERLKGLEDPLAFLSVEGIQARANAIGELADSLDLGLKRALDEISQMNWAAATIDFFLGILGKDVESKLSKNLSFGIKSAFETANAGPVTDAARKKIEEILGESVSSAKLPDIIETLIETGQTDKLRQVVKEVNKLGSEQRITAAKGTELKESIGAVSTSLKEFTNSLKPTDQLYKIADTTSVSLNKLQIALQDSVQTINAMNIAVNSLDLLAAFPPDVALNLVTYKDRLADINKELARAQPIADAYTQKVDELRNRIASMPEQARSQRMYLIGELGRLLDQKPVEVDVVANIKAETGRLKAVFDKAFGEGMIYNAQLAAVRISQEFQKAKTVVTSFLADQLGDTRAGIEIRSRLEKQRIDAELEGTKAAYNLSLTMDRLRIAVEQQELATRESSLKQEKAGNLGPIDKAREEQITRELARISQRNTQLMANMGFVEDIQAGKKVRTPQQILKDAQVTSPRVPGGTVIVPEKVDRELLEQAQKYQEFLVKLERSNKEKQVIDIKADIERAKLRTKEIADNIKQEQALLKTKQDSLNLLSQSTILNSQEFNTLKSKLDLQDLDLKYAQDRLALQTDIDAKNYALERLRKEGTTVGKETLKADRDASQEALRRLEINYKSARLLSTLKNSETEITKTLERQREARQQELELDSLQVEKRSSLFNLEKLRLDIVKDIDSMSKVELQNRQNLADTIELQLSQEQKLKSLENDRIRALESLQESRIGIQSTLYNLEGAGDLVDPVVIETARAQLRAIDQQIKDTNSRYDERLKVLKEILNIDKESLKIKQQDAALIAEFQDREKQIQREREQRAFSVESIEQESELERRLLDLLRENGKLSEDVYNNNIRLMERAKQERELENLEIEISNKYQDRRNKLLLQEQRIKAQRAGGILLDDEAQALEDQRDRDREDEARERGRLATRRRYFDQINAETRNLSERQKGYSQIFEKSFESMGDAIANFAQTGKFSFKDFINSVLMDILRLELRMQQQELWKSFRTGGSDGMGFLGNIFKFFGGSTPSLATPGTFGIDTLVPMAKGGTFGTYEKFAKGGMFTNSIVDNPTIFKFAKGVGMMGEAGPEAIMPLKRDSSGNLGVSGSEGKTEVVINNYTGEKAEAKESRDTRGNRRVEVIVGDMTAGEISRSGSNTNRTMRETFGLQPQLIRR